MSSPEARTMRVLVIDDDALVRTALRRSLERLGYEVSEAGDGPQGLEAIATAQPEIVMLDLRMPKLDGHTVLRRLEAVGARSAVVIISGDGDMDDVVEVLRHGAVDYVKKPWSPTDLVSAVTRAIAAYEARGRAQATKASAVPESPLAVTPSGRTVAGGTSTPVATAQPGPGASPSSLPATPAAPRPPVALDDLLGRLRRGEVPVPAVPSVLVSLRTLMNQPNVDVDQVAARIENDQRLTADLLRLSNTPRYARGGPNSSIKTAVARIGFRQVYSVVETVLLQGVFRAKNPEVQKLIMTLWRRSVAQAMSMRGISDLLGGSVSSDAAYLAGLMSDVGASLLLWAASERGDAGTLDEAAIEAMLEAVRRNHPTMGARMLTQWKLDPAVVLAVERHHSPVPPATKSPYWAISVVASAMTDQITEAPDLTAPAPTDPLLVERCTTDMKISAATLERLLEQLRKEYAALIDTIG